MRSRHSFLLVACASLSLADACGGADKTAGPSAVPSIATVSAVQFQAVVGHVVTPDPTVRVTDPAGNPVSGANVLFFTTSDQFPTVTGADGLASVPWRLGERAGAQTLTARLYDPKTMPRPKDVTFSARALPDTVAAIYTLVGGSQGGLPSQPVLTRPALVAADQYYNVTPGVRVTFEATGGGSVEPAVAVTDSNGRANVGTWTLGADFGVDTLIARVGTLPPLYFTVNVSPPFRALAVVTGNESTCAIAIGGDVYCWGTNARGRINASDAANFYTLPQRVSLPAKAVSISGGYNYTCVITDEAPPQAYCWGDNSTGQLGVVTTGPAFAGPRKVPVADGLAAVATGLDHSCGLTPAGVAYCWGNGTLGQLGAGDITGCYIADNGVPNGCPGPRPVVGSARFATLAAGASETCGVTLTGQMWCWGDADNNRLGFAASPVCTEDDYYYGTYPVDCALVPQQVPSNSTFSSVAAEYNTCGLDRAGAIVCFGPPRGFENVPTLVSYARMTPDARCALGSDDHAYCWGNAFDAIDATFDQPKPVAQGLSLAAITSADAHRCAILKSDASVVCWGNNEAGQLGNGTTFYSSGPSPVLIPSKP
jgi:alpha-tubulin suppressor-like RCC1 family protein